MKISQKRTDTTFACPLVGRRELQERQKSHRDRVHSAKSVLDTRPPAAQPHLTTYGRDYGAKKKATTEAAFSDLKMIQSIARTMTRKHEIPERKGPVTLNAVARKQEITRIVNENNRLLESIEQVGPVMSTSKMIQNFNDRQRYVINCSHTMRLSGEYEIDMTRLRQQDKDRMDAAYRNTLLRREVAQKKKLQVSMSLPSLGVPSSPEQGPPLRPGAPLRPSAVSSSFNDSTISYSGEAFQHEASSGAQPSTALPRNDSSDNADVAVAASASQPYNTDNAGEALRIRAKDELLGAVDSGTLATALEKKSTQSAAAEQAATSAAEASAASKEDLQESSTAPAAASTPVAAKENEALTADKMVERSNNVGQP